MLTKDSVALIYLRFGISACRYWWKRVQIFMVLARYECRIRKGDMGRLAVVGFKGLC